MISRNEMIHLAQKAHVDISDDTKGAHTALTDYDGTALCDELPSRPQYDERTSKYY